MVFGGQWGPRRLGQLHCALFYFVFYFVGVWHTTSQATQQHPPTLTRAVPPNQICTVRLQRQVLDHQLSARLRGKGLDHGGLAPARLAYEEHGLARGDADGLFGKGCCWWGGVFWGVKIEMHTPGSISHSNAPPNAHTQYI